jgi:uncharacterized membrane protein YhhN
VAGRGWRWALFAPFLVVSTVQLATKVTNDAALDHVTKALCVPLLALAVIGVLVAARRRPDAAPTALLLLGLAFSTLGDVLIEAALVLGLACFLLAHLAYIGMLLVGFPRRIAWGALLVLPWYGVLIAVIAPNLGGLLVPVLVYGAALGGMAAAATRGGALTTLGGALFVVSDTMLALRLFTPILRDDLAELLIMLAYLAAQSLLALGMLGRLASWPTPSSRESAPGTSRTRRTRASRSPG